MEWQPIETAPKDGRMAIFWNGEDMAILNQPPNCARGVWHKSRGKWVGAMIFFPRATHWMPLPEPPK